MADQLMSYGKVLIPGVVVLAWLALLVAQAFNPGIAISPELSTAAVACLGVFGGVVVERANARLR